MSFAYLWNNRKRSRLLSYAWCKDWAKRMLSSPVLFRSVMLQRGIVASGGSVGCLTFMANCVFNGKRERLSVGSNSYIGCATLHLHEKIVIGNNVVINDGVSLLTASHDISSPEWRSFAKPIKIGDFAWIAINAIILPGVSIGTGAVVGAGAVVSRDVPDYCIAVGNPATIMDKKRCQELAYNPVRFISCISAWLG